MSVHIRRLTTSHGPVFLVNSRLSLVTASRLLGNPFSLGYGVNLPSSLARILSHTLGFSPRLPVSVYGTVTHLPHLEAFLGSMIRVGLWAKPSYSHFRIAAADLPTTTPYVLKPGQSKPGQPFTSASPLRSNRSPVVREYSTRFPSLTPFGLSLGAD